MRALSQLDAPVSGSTAFIDGDTESSQSNPRWRRRCIYVPQALPSLIGTPKDFILQACAYKCRSRTAGSQQLVKNIDLACHNIEIRLGLDEGKLSQVWSELSGGQRQRAIIACGLLLAASFHATLYDMYFNTVDMTDSPLADADSAVAVSIDELNGIEMHQQFSSPSSSSSLHRNREKDTFNPLQQSEFGSTPSSSPRVCANGRTSSGTKSVRFSLTNMVAGGDASSHNGCVLLLDEPTAACDMETSLLVERALVTSGCTLIMITHDERQAIRMAHKRLMLTSVAVSKV